MTSPTRPARERLPIKLIMPNQGRERPVQGGGKAPVPFREVTPELRASLGTQVRAIETALLPQIERAGAAAVRVQLLSRALAKSHRPERLFCERTCPIIGAGSHGELYVKATPSGLAALRLELEDGASARLIKDISTVAAIEAVTPAQRRRNRSPLEVLQASPRAEENRFVVRVRLFDFGPSRDQERLVEDFDAQCGKRDLPIWRWGYGEHGTVLAVGCRDEADVDALSRIVGVRSLIGMPLLRTIRTRALNDAPAPALPSATDVEGDFPTVVVVDSGIDPSNTLIASWVVGRESSVAPPYQNPTHGTFVAGLIVFGDRLNPHLPDIDTGPCGVFDLQVIPNADPHWGSGDVERVTEQEFLQSLESALKRHANRFKVWNLSLSSGEVCAEDEFSAFAEKLDDLQEQYQVSFVIAAGNYELPPLLDFPRLPQQLSIGRITAPADSVLGIAVGAISHLDYAERGPRREEPSPFSRHGAGPNHIIKPDLVHYGGTCTTDVSHIGGIRSLTPSGTGEDIGTSFAAPLVSRSLAQIYHQIAPVPSPVLARALLTHHARDPRSRGRVPMGDEDYFGFGRPVPPPYCIECEPHQSTLIFEDTLRPGFFLEWNHFPFPPSLYREGRFYGEVFMTIAFAPTRGARWGTEYCETHIDAHFGVYRTVTSRRDAAGERRTSERFVGLVPPEHANPDRLFEEVQIKELRKWAPVRTYHGDLSAGERGNHWRMMVRLLTRHGVEGLETRQAQPFALIVTIADPERRAPVYDEMAQLIRTQYQAQNLTVRAEARIRGAT
ncbi:MAG: S8 family peptidase [Gemmatimonadetes bacterium]|nr:S8 family peptidase [Gemmatimonadota bacterium]